MLSSFYSYGCQNYIANISKNIILLFYELFKFIFNFMFLLKYSWFTMLYYFLVYRKAIQLYIYNFIRIFFQILFPFKLLQNIEYSPLYSTVGPCSLSCFIHTCMLSCFSRIWPFVTLWTVAHQAPLSMGILQARVLEWVAISSSRVFYI